MGTAFAAAKCGQGGWQGVDCCPTDVVLVDGLENNESSNFEREDEEGICRDVTLKPDESFAIAEFVSGMDEEVNEALESPSYVRMREQVQALIDGKQRCRDESKKRFWEEQITFSKNQIVEALEKDFGKERAQPYVVAMREYWQNHESELFQSETNRCPIDCELFFQTFDIEKQGLITLPEFTIILEEIDPELACRDNIVNTVFMFLDQNERNSFNIYDLECFMNKKWTGDVGRFHKKITEFMTEPFLSKKSHEVQLKIRKKGERNGTYIPYDFATFDFAEDFEEHNSPTEKSEFECPPHLELLEKIRKLQQDLESQNFSSAYGEWNRDSPRFPSQRMGKRMSIVSPIVSPKHANSIIKLLRMTSTPGAYEPEGEKSMT